MPFAPSDIMAPLPPTLRPAYVSKDPFLEREAEKYENPIASREMILDLIKGHEKPMSREELAKVLKLTEEEPLEALRRRLRAMERDGQLVFTRNQCYALPDRLNLVKGYVLGHKDGFGFLRPEGGGPDLFLNNREMQRLMHGDYALVQPTEIDRKGRQEARLVRLLKSREADIVGRYFVENGVGFVVPDDSRIGQDIIIPEGENKGLARARSWSCASISAPPPASMRSAPSWKCWVKTWRPAWRSRSPCVPTAFRTLGRKR